MVIKDLYKLAACTSFVSRYLWIKDEVIDFETVNMNWFSFKKERKLYEYLYGDIVLSSDKNTIFVNTGNVGNADANLINKKINDGFWVLKHYSCGNFEFKWYEVYEDGKKAFKSIKLHSIIHPNTFIDGKYLFIFKNGQFALVKYEKERKRK